MEYRVKILVLDERVYKGKQRLYVSVADGLGIIKIIGRNLSMLGTYSVQIRKGRNLYYLVEAEPLQDYSYILRNPIVVESYSRIYKILYETWPQNGDLYTKMLRVVERLDREPQTTYTLLQDILNGKDETDTEELLSVLTS
ncbi:MAG: hypothetical protein GXO39_08180 [Thermotogae bacterium]|nr:hypothetical protein [Thermotogota bacterium]